MVERDYWMVVVERRLQVNSLQERLKALSPNSRRVIARSSSHAVMIDRPDVVIRAIEEMVVGEIGHDVGTTSLQ